MSKPNTTEIVTELIKGHSARFFRGQHGEHCIFIVEDGKQKTMAIRSSQGEAWLTRFLRKKEWPRSPFQLGIVMNEICALADDSEKAVAQVRVGRTDDSVQIDLNDDTYNVVQISESKKGFKVAQPKDVYLLRPYKQQPLPKPVSCGRKEFLNRFRKLMPEFVYGHWLLVLTFILKALNRDRGSYAILVIGGPQGSGKTILSRRIKTMIDPAEPPYLSPPRSPDDIITAAFHAYLLVFENISGISHEMADFFCRLATGGGVSKRKHYTDHEEAFYNIHRPVIINGIDEPSNRPDFLDRCISLELKPIRDDGRIAETELDDEFKDNLPALLGGLYELLADCLRILPSIQETNLPRMTDYALMGIAAEKALNLKPGTFLQTYADNRADQTENAFWSDDLACAVYEKIANAPDNRIEGSAHDLMKILFRRGSGHASTPRSARGFSGWLKRIEPLLKMKGISVKRPPRSAGKRNIVIHSEAPIEREKSDFEKRGRTFKTKASPKAIDHL